MAGNTRDVYLDQLKASDAARELPRDLQTRWILKNYQDLSTIEFAQSYDLILANPPYFHAEQGALSPKDFKNRCRFFLDSTQEALIKTVLHCLKGSGQAFVLVRDQKEHGQDALAVWQKTLRYEAQVMAWKKIRTTHLLRIQR